MVGVGSLVDGRLNKVTNRLVRLATCKKLEGRIRLGSLESLGKLVERCLVDDGSREQVEVRRISSVSLNRLNGLGFLDQLLLEFRPNALGNIKARGGRTLLALVFKRSTHGGLDGMWNVGRLVDDVEVLTTSLTNNTGYDLY